MVGAVRQPVGPGAEVDGGGHHQLLADRVDRRIGDLGKELAEVLVEEAGFAGEDGQGRVVAHRANGLLGLLDHGEKNDLQLLVRVTEGKQTGVQIRGDGGELGRSRGQGAQAGLHPFAIGLGRGGELLDVVVAEKFFIHGIDRDHFPRAEAALFRDVLIGQIADPDLRTHDDESILGNFVAGGA